jgi:hypothetical protein
VQSRELEGGVSCRCKINVEEKADPSSHPDPHKNACRDHRSSG